MAYELATGEQLGALMIDHTCHNPACCNPADLRPATNKQNQEYRRGAQRNSKSGVLGVCWDKRKRRSHARVMHYGKTIHVGTFATVEAADAAARARRLELFTYNDADRRAAAAVEAVPR